MRQQGPQLLEECRKLNGCRTGEAKITGAYNLPAHYVIHTAGPVWHGGYSGEPALLASCYTQIAAPCAALRMHSIAFPA